jgi:hypothetical protein
MSFKRQTLVCAAVGCMLAAGGASSLATPNRTATTCGPVPASGNIGSGVYAQSSSRSSTSWTWSGSASGGPYHWYVFNSSNVLLADGQVNNGSGSGTVVAPGVHYWKVQNQGTSPTHWDSVCSS